LVWLGKLPVFILLNRVQFELAFDVSLGTIHLWNSPL
jgi:hypothetical protein